MQDCPRRQSVTLKYCLQGLKMYSAEGEVRGTMAGPWLKGLGKVAGPSKGETGGQLGSCLSSSFSPSRPLLTPQGCWNANPCGPTGPRCVPGSPPVREHRCFLSIINASSFLRLGVAHGARLEADPLQHMETCRVPVCVCGAQSTQPTRQALLPSVHGRAAE